MIFVLFCVIFLLNVILTVLTVCVFYKFYFIIVNQYFSVLVWYPYRARTNKPSIGSFEYFYWPLMKCT
jgi:hypothetical protein